MDTQTQTSFNIMVTSMTEAMGYETARQKAGENAASELFVSTQHQIAYMEREHKGRYTKATRKELADKFNAAGAIVYTEDKNGKIKENAAWVRSRTVFNSANSRSHFKGCDTFDKVQAKMPNGVLSFGQFKTWSQPAEKPLSKSQQDVVAAMNKALAGLDDWATLSTEQQDAAKRSNEQTVRNTSSAVVTTAKKAKAAAKKSKAQAKAAIGKPSNKKRATQ